MDFSPQNTNFYNDWGSDTFAVGEKKKQINKKIDFRNKLVD